MFEVLRTCLPQGALRRQAHGAGAQEGHNSAFDLVLSQLRGFGNTDLPAEVLQVVEIPIAVLEFAKGHGRRESAWHEVPAFQKMHHAPTRSRFSDSVTRWAFQKSGGVIGGPL